MSLFKSLISDIKETNRVKHEKENKLWSLIENMDLSNKQIEYDIWNEFFGAKQYRIISPSGDYISIDCPEPRVCEHYYNISYYKSTSNYYHPHEHVCHIAVGGCLIDCDREIVIKRLVQDLETRKHLNGKDVMDRF